MRVLHTSDWHLGRTLEGRSRLPEQEQFLTELCGICSSEKVDMVLVAGDVFDGSNPPARAEELYYDALERLCDGGTRAVVVIAGNHDSPDRIRAANPLAVKHGISLVGYPGDDLGPGGPIGSARRVRAGQGWLEVHCPTCDQTAFIVTLAYPSESRLNEVIGESLTDNGRQAAYSDRVAELLNGRLAFARDDTVRLVVGHLFAFGCKESDSERQIQLGGALAVRPEAFDPGIGYVALGHLHRPQAVSGSPVPCRYSGSPLSYSFSESDHQKEVLLVDLAKDGQVAVTPIGLTSGKPLKRWTPKNLEEALRWCADARNLNCWVDMELVRDQPLTVSEISTLRAAHPGLVNIRLRSSAQTPIQEEKRISELPLVDRFRLFCQRNGTEPDQPLLDLFLELVNQDGKEGAEVEASRA
ncbi:MAG: metallophosphoesterase family protein [Bacillota bacterium]